MVVKNKLVYCVLQIVKENVLKNKEPLYNPIILTGLVKVKRYRFFFTVFNKDFISKYKSFVHYDVIDAIDLEMVSNKKLIIVENVQMIVKNKNYQDKLNKLLDWYFKQKIQVVLGSDLHIQELEIDEVVKSKILYWLEVFI